MLVIVSTHPVQYHAPVFRAVARRQNVPVHIVYGSDFSVKGYYDAEFRESFAWDVPLITDEDQCSFLEHAAEGGAKCFDEVSARGIGREYDRLNPSAVLIMGYQPRFHLDAFWAAWRRGIPVLFRAETTDHAFERNRGKQALRDLFLRTLYGRCSRLLPIGSRSRQHYRRLGVPEHKLIESPYCVDTAPFRTGEDARAELREATRAELGISGNRIAVLFSGKLSVRKGTHVLVDAVGRMPAGLRERIVIVFVGQGEESERLKEQAASLGLAARFTGFQNQTKLSRYYHAADMFTLPSIESETWGLVVNEALHHGVPCVVSDGVGSAPDLVTPGVTGEVAGAGDAAALAAALERAVALTGKGVREACRTRVAGYTVEKAAAGIAQAYWGVAGGPASAKVG